MPHCRFALRLPLLYLLAAWSVLSATAHAAPGEGQLVWQGDFPAYDWQSGWNIPRAQAYGLDNFSVVSDHPPHGGSGALRVQYPAGSSSNSSVRKHGAPSGGGQFVGLLPQPLEAAALEYSLRFAPGFAFHRGGKLPGLMSDPAMGQRVSGKQLPDGTNGFSTRFMWRENGAGEIYAYLPPKLQDGLKVNAKHGTSIDRGAFHFTPGKWERLRQEIRLNTPGQANGSIRVWHNGKLVIDQAGVVFRSADSLQVAAVFFSTFFGGSGPDWASPLDQHVDFADFRVYRLP